jgi:TonB family protein
MLGSKLLAAIVLAAVSLPAHSDTSDLHRHMLDRYQGKTLLLRGFYSGDRLRYNCWGELTDSASSGDWTLDAFITVRDVRVSGDRVVLRAVRQLVVVDDKQFQLRPKEKREAGKKSTKPVFVEIETQVGSKSSPAQVDAAFSRIFLTEADSFAEMVPDFWKACVSEGLRGKNASCRFSPELRALPGLAVAVVGSAGSPLSISPSTSVSEPPGTSGKSEGLHPVFQMGNGIKPPKLIYAPEPEFSDPARVLKYQGTSTLGVTVDQEGVPRRIRILNPLGCGLDEKAVRAVERWRFQPAEKDGQPVSVMIAVETNFHLY